MRSVLIAISLLAGLMATPGCRHSSPPAPEAATPPAPPEPPTPPTPPAPPQSPTPLPPPPQTPVADPPATPPAPPAPPIKGATAGKQGESCGAGGACEAGLKCIEFYGIAGAAGGKLTSCEIPCTRKTRCPTGQTCTAISDGPGSVCRAM